MAFTVSDLKNDMIRKLHGTTLAKLTDVDGLIYEGARNVLSHVDPVETKAFGLLSTPLYSDIFNYQAPADLKGNKIVDLRPQIDRRIRDDFTNTNNSEFDQYKRQSDNQFTVEFRNGTKFLRVRKRLTGGVTLHQLDTIAGNGTWAASNDATNLRIDTLNKISGAASLRFDLDGLTTDGFIENSTFTAVDGSDQEDQGSLFLRVFFPMDTPSTAITSVDLRWGSSSSDYWNRTVTVTQEGAAFMKGWNLLRFDWNGATETGTPVSSALDYSRITINYDSVADTDLRVDELTLQNGTLFEILYYSKFLFSDATTGAFQEKVTADTNVINLDTESYNLLVYETTYLAAQQVQGEDSAFDAGFYREEKDAYYKRYRADNPSEIKKMRTTYYRMPIIRRSRGSDGPRAVNEGNTF